MEFPKVRVAAVQASPVMLDTDATIEKVCKFVDEAASNGAKVIAFPEAYVPGYPYWIWLGGVDYGMKYFVELFKQAVQIPGPAVRKLSEAAKRNDVYFCVSVTEREGNSLYLTQLWFGPDGSLLGKHRKNKATSQEKTIWGDGDGSMMPVFNTKYGILGGLQCWEHHIPLNIAAMGAQGEQIHVASWPVAMWQEGHLFGIEQSLTATKYYSQTNQCFCLLASQIWTEDQADVICETPEQRDGMKVGYGFARIIAPNGTEIGTHLDHDEEGITYADADLSQIIPGRYIIDTAGMYSTPGFLSLTFDRSVHKAVKIVGDSAPLSMSYDEIQNEED